MGYRLTERHRDIVQKINEKIKKNITSDEQQKLLGKFVEQYYAMVADEDLSERNVIDLYGAVLSHWNFCYQRKNGEIKIRVFNPGYEQHGWQSTHTIIEVNVDDMPFLVDSIRMELTKLGYTIQLMINPGCIRTKRGQDGKIQSVYNPGEKVKGKCNNESALYIEIEQETDQKILEHIQEQLVRVIKDVTVTVEDWEAMCQKAIEFANQLKQSPPPIDEDELTETIDFISWIANNNFTFLGCRDYEIKEEKSGKVLKVIPNSGLGQLRDERTKHTKRKITDFSEEAQEEALSSEKVLVIQQLSETSTVHRPSAPYYIGLKRIDEDGNVIGERRFIGLYTSVAYHSSPTIIPFIRKKIRSILAMANLSEYSHSGKHLLNILETYPRDELFQMQDDELYLTVMGIFHLQERRKIRLFIRKDPYDRFYSALVYVPRDQFNSLLREKIGQVLKDELDGINTSFTTQFSESILARIHFIIRRNPDVPKQTKVLDVEDLEKRIVHAARTWDDELILALHEYYGEARCVKLHKKYQQAFPPGYRDQFSARTAVYDIEHFEALSEDKTLDMSFYRPLESIEGDLHFKLYCYDTAIALSDILPMLENMGLRVIGERSHDIQLPDGGVIWLSDFKMSHQSGMAINVERVRLLFQEGFLNTWQGNAENDGFNALILSAELNWQETAILRAYAKYMRQIGFTLSQNYIEQALIKHPSIVQKLVKLFHARFDPKEKSSEAKTSKLKEEIIKDLDNVDSLDEDRIVRRYLDLILATLRTNFYQLDSEQQSKNYISFKIEPCSVPDMPLPIPALEFFVYSPRVEGVHLRSARVARGGLRWSDRREDFRTEVLGLMKAQQVKNAVIVPAGAKGGFVPKSLPESGSRDEVMAEVVSCYRTFISGILDLTDNLVKGEVVPPQNIVRYDDDDYYLVVAADKGTATFSDIANDISKQYNFWLGDAFASGGSEGYDHKKMGITARGAWESVKRHFLEIGIDVQSEPFTVAGVGDMAGDVFGNGMLCSESIKLVAAFNHMHIFIDPTPDPKTSYIERKRMFDLPRSTWADYNAELISKGGGVFSRHAKWIKLTPEIKKLLDVDKDAMMPNDLIQAILKAPVDLLWNGGIGTYVKATRESNVDVGDRANDAVRINGKELRCRVVGEGGNLGLTQLGRVEYNLNNGISFTDFIDNVGGVDCSDHEVNIKILLDSIVRSGDLTEKQRNEMLLDMTNEVADLVLKNNYDQTRALSLAALRASATLDEYRRFINSLERMGRLDRELEFLPDEDELGERKAEGVGLTRPELSVLLAYSKILLKEELLDSDAPEDPYLSDVLSTAFPKRLARDFGPEMQNHKMKREIIATQLSNIITNEMGVTFVKRLFDETGAPAPSVAKSFIVAREIFSMDVLWVQIESIDKIVTTELQLNMMVEALRLLRRSTRWFLRNRRLGMDIGETIAYFKPKVKELSENLRELLVGHELDHFNKTVQSYLEQGIPESLALRIAGTGAMISALDIIEAAQHNDLEVTKVAEAYYALGANLQLDWFRNEISNHSVSSNWDALARAACKDDLDRQQRSITEGVLAYKTDENDVNNSMELWMNEHQILVDRWFYMVADLKATKSRAFTMFTVALRELLDIAQASNNKRASNDKKT